MNSRFLTVFAVVALAGAAVADDTKPEAPAPKPAVAAETAPGTQPAQKTPDKAAPTKSETADTATTGTRSRVNLRAGRTVEGVVLASSTWERRDAEHGWVEADRDEKGAGVRLWWVGDLDGFMFVPASEVQELKELETVDAEAFKTLERKRELAAQITERERAKQDDARAAETDFTAKAKALVEEVEQARADAAEAAAKGGAGKVDVAQARRWAELLLGFPPEKWTVDLPEQIERRKVQLHVFPNEQELEFLKVFAEWKQAQAAWAEGQAAKSTGQAAKK